jgi:phosphohistidine phosphatase
MSFHLYIMRHAKSDWAASGSSDFERPLNKRGNKNAIRMGRWMVENEKYPERIISSPAIRAKQTIELVTDQFKDKQLTVNYDKTLYLATLDVLIETIQLYKNDVNSLMLVAHNPGLEQLIYFLSIKSDDEYKSLTTANLIILEYPDNQFDPFTDKGKLIEFIKPKELD